MAAYGWEPAPWGEGAREGWGGGGNIFTVGYFVYKFDNFAVVFGRKK